MRRVVTLATACGLAWALVGAGESRAQESIPAKPVTSQAIWRASGEQLAAIRKECPLKWMQTLVDCFVEAMESDGAPAEAIALTKALGKDERYLTNLRENGLVRVADVQRPGIGTAWGTALVNGNPPVIDGNAPEVLEWIRQDAMARGLLAGNPGLAIDPIASYLKSFPISHLVDAGGQEFTVGYTTLEGCAWCKTRVFVRFRFDGDGNFLGVSIQNIARDEDAGMLVPDPDDGNVRRKVLRYKVGDVIPFKMRWVGDASRVVAPIDPTVIREVQRGWGGSFCAGVCLGEDLRFFEAIGRGETHLVFRIGQQNRPFSPPEMVRVEYVIQVE